MANSEVAGEIVHEQPITQRRACLCIGQSGGIVDCEPSIGHSRVLQHVRDEQHSRPELLRASTPPAGRAASVSAEIKAQA